MVNIGSAGVIIVTRALRRRCTVHSPALTLDTSFPLRRLAISINRSGFPVVTAVLMAAIGCPCWTALPTPPPGFLFSFRLRFLFLVFVSLSSTFAISILRIVVMVLFLPLLLFSSLLMALLPLLLCLRRRGSRLNQLAAVLDYHTLHDDRRIPLVSLHPRHLHQRLGAGLKLPEHHMLAIQMRRGYSGDEELRNMIGP